MESQKGSAENFCLVGVPLRRASTRVPEKIFADIQGEALGSRVIARLVERFGDRKNVRLIAAVDDQKTASFLEVRFKTGVEIVMTDPALPSGTDRVFAAYLDFQKRNPGLARPSGIINVQGDMPWLDAAGLEPILDYYSKTESKKIAAVPILTLSQDWPADADFLDNGQVKVLSDRERLAIYFSRFPIPYSRFDYSAAQREPEFSSYAPELHIGVYGYTPEALAEFCSHGAIALEKFEGLEQLRAMWLGRKILVIKVDVDANHSFRGVDMPADLKWARAFGQSNSQSKSNSKPKTKTTKPKTAKAVKKKTKPTKSKGKKSK